MASGEATFLELARRAVYERPDSPYRTLLHEAGCERGPPLTTSTGKILHVHQRSSADPR
jgi:hypothetical protein